MNIKLLKLVRKRFAYYKNSKGIWVLIDHSFKIAYTIDKERLLSEYPKFPEEDITDEVLFKCLKALMIKPTIHNYLDRVRYNYANRVFRKKSKNL